MVIYKDEVVSLPILSNCLLENMHGGGEVASEGASIERDVFCTHRQRQACFPCRSENTTHVCQSINTCLSVCMNVKLNVLSIHILCICI